MTKMSVSIPDMILDQDDDNSVFEGVFQYLLRIFGNQIPSSDEIESRLDISEPAKIAWYLWLFATDVSSAGIPDYLLNHCPSIEQLILTHHALKMVRASELLVLFEAAIPLVREIAKQYGQFSVLPNHEWLDQFKPNPLWLDLERISEQSWSLASAPFSTLVANYLRNDRPTPSTSN
jgi:hypothetical protein